MKNSECSVVIPVSQAHVSRVKLVIPYIKKNLVPKNIVIICRKDLHSAFGDLPDVMLLDENGIFDNLNYSLVKKSIEKRITDTSRTGWYFQQFIKMQYAYISDDEYYVVWDADTMPLKPIQFFENDKMLINLKTEHHLPYFETIKKLGNADEFCFLKKSFISEGMVIKTAIMQELITWINASKIEGETWYEKVINAIDIDDVGASGFSEFETYGNYINSHYPELINMRILKTLRTGYEQFGGLPEPDELKIYEQYDTVSFEVSTRKPYIESGYVPGINVGNSVIQKGLFDQDEYMKFIKHEEKFNKALQCAKRVFVYGAGKIGRMCKNYIEFLGYLNKFIGFVETIKKDEEWFDTRVYSYEEYSANLYEEGDLIVVAAGDKARMEILSNIECKRFCIAEYTEQFALGLHESLRLKELDYFIKRNRTKISDVEKDILIIELCKMPNECLIKEICKERNKKIDLIVSTGVKVSEEITRQMDDIYYFNTPEVVRPYSVLTEQVVNIFCQVNKLKKYKRVYLCGEMPVGESNYYEGIQLSLKCGEELHGYLSGNSEIEKCYADIYAPYFFIDNTTKGV